MLAVCAVLLSLAVYLDPDRRGLGTHEQLGFGTCGFVTLTGFPCPTCGMTTAFCHTVRGQWWRAILAQPMGFLMALATGVLAAGAGVVIVRGKTWRIDWWRVNLLRLVIGLFVLFFGSWAFKMIVGLLDGSLPARR
ncbi:MAG: DUF2752 domain-containing protein [Planctomycetales bacterium]|nr:DUF2752 domain-containing protein [Planctomycetales bacterium]